MSTTAPKAYRCSFSALLLFGVVLLAETNEVFAQNCPRNSIYHCDNPSTAQSIWSDDLTVQCDPSSCVWREDLFSPTTKPVHCANLVIIRASDPVPDFLEPCLLWELRYGDFAPTPAPSISNMPTLSHMPSSSPTRLPSASPTSIPSLIPSYSPTLLPTSIPTVVPLTTVATTASPPSPVTPTGTPEQNEGKNPVTVTVVEKFNHVLLTFIFPDSGRRSLRALESLSIQARAELYYTTEAHLMATIPELQDVQLVITPYQEYRMEGQVAVTEMLQGSLTLSRPIDSPQVDAKKLLAASFSGSALSSYLEQIRMTSETNLSRMLDISFGIPLGVPDTVENPSVGSRDHPVETDKGQDSFSWSGLWIGILVCGSIGIFGLVVVGVVMLSRNSGRVRVAVGLKSSNTGSFTNGSPTSMEPQLVRRMQSFDVIQSPSGKEQTMNPDDDELPEITREEDVYFQDMQSEITSVYSFVDRTGLNDSVVTDDQSYLMAPSYYMRKSSLTQGEECSELVSPLGDQNSSTLWSVMDGIRTSPPKTSTDKDDNSPSQLVISASQQNTDDNDLYIFNDDVSLVSENSERMTSNILRMETDDGRPTSPIGNESLIRNTSLSQNKTLDNKEISQQEESDGEPGAVAEAPSNVSAILRAAEKKPLADLSQVMETSETSQSTSRASTNGRRSAPSSAKKNGSRRSGDSLKEESTDDSSLFMGPDYFAKENQPGNKRILSLGEEDKVNPTSSANKEQYKITALFRSNSKLSEKDKVRLGVKQNPSRDDSSLGESFILPGSYALADFRDDMSISTSGSLYPRGRYSGSTMASF